MVSTMSTVLSLASVAVVFGQPGGWQQYVHKYAGSKQYMDKYTDSGNTNSNTTGFGNYEKYVHQYAQGYEKYMSSADQSSSTGKAAGNIPAYSKKYLDQNAKGFEKYMDSQQGNKSFMSKYAGGSSGDYSQYYKQYMGQGGGEGSTDDYSQYYKKYMDQGMKGGGGASGSSSGDYSQYYKKYMQKYANKSHGDAPAQSDPGPKEVAKPAEASSQSKAKEVAKPAEASSQSKAIQPSGKALHNLRQQVGQPVPSLARQPEWVPDKTKTSATQEELVTMSQPTASPMAVFFAVAFMAGFSLTTLALVRRHQAPSESDDSMTGYFLQA